MGTKNDPGKYDCHAAAADDEPIFTLRARDPLAPATVRAWLAMRRITRPATDSRREADKQDEAEKCARDMERWFADNAPDAQPADVHPKCRGKNNEGGMGPFQCCLTDGHVGAHHHPAIGYWAGCESTSEQGHAGTVKCELQLGHLGQHHTTFPALLRWNDERFDPLTPPGLSCDATHKDLGGDPVQCEMPTGHQGDHRRGNMTWRGA